jgi:methionyl-tRNA synthetase (EC 6.1.1.10)
MLRAEAEGVTPETLIANVKAEHQADFADFQIGFDHYSSTHSTANQYYAELIYTRVRDAAGSLCERSNNSMILKKGSFLLIAT